MKGDRISRLRAGMADGAPRMLSDVLIAAGYDPTDRKLRHLCSISMHFARDFERVGPARWRRIPEIQQCATRRLLAALDANPRHLEDLIEAADIESAKRASYLLSSARSHGHKITNNRAGYWWRTDVAPQLEQEAAQ